MTNRKRIFIASILVLGGIGWGIYHFVSGPEWQQFSAAALWESLSGARLSYLLLGAGLTFASYLCRAYRWKAFVRPMKEAGVGNIFIATLVGFSAVALLSRVGEVVRPWMIAQKEQLPLSSQLGAWTLERVFDTLTLVSLLGASLWLFPAPIAAGAQALAMMQHFRTAGVVLTFMAMGMAAVLALLHYVPEFTENLIVALAWPLPQRIRDGIRRALEHFAATLAVIRNARSFLECVFWSSLVWLALLGAYWSTVRAFGEPLAGLHWGAMTLVMMASVTGSVAQLPAVGGGTQLATALTLTGLFGIPLAPATAVALTLWVMTFLLVLIPGLPLAAREGLSWSRLRSILFPNGGS
ncbi:MAG: flippase-like domain-containing protein [Acidobacteria bacterium]|nr:flippase-like domain-containing protein [Acidobacteriota bacterium]